MQKPKLMTLAFDPVEPDIVVINGFRITIDLIQALTEGTAPTRWFRIISRSDGTITVQQKVEPETEATA